MKEDNFAEELKKLCVNKYDAYKKNITNDKDKKDESSDKKETKKKKKKKSMLCKMTLYDDELKELSPNDLLIDENDDISNMMIDGESIADLIERRLDDIDNSFSDDIIVTERKRYKNSKPKDSYEEEFSQVLALLYDSLKSNEQLDKDLDKLVKPAFSSRNRQMSKYVVDLIAAKISNNGNKLSTIKEISATLKKISDLRSNDKKNASYGGEHNPDLIAGAFFDRVSSMGRNSFVNMVSQPGAINAISDVEFEDVSDYDTESSEVNYNGLSEDKLIDVDMDEVLKDVPLGRSEEDSLRVKYEPLKPKIIIVKYPSDNTWEFYAIDKNGEIIEDYPVPNKNDVGRVIFSYDGRTASDSQGKVYTVYENDDSEDDYDDNDIEEYDYGDLFDDEDDE